MRECIWCNKETNNPKFCSLSCGAKHQHSQPKTLKSKTKICIQCNKQFEYKGNPKQKYCGRSCSTTFNNKGKVRNKLGGTQQAISKLVTLCEYCQQRYVVKYTGQRYCSVRCSTDSKSINVICAWILNPNTGTSKQGLKRSIKRHLIKEAGYKCSLCGWGEINPSTGRSPLEVDHIDGDCYNNARENLRVVCPNCHSLTPTYRALNKNGKRKYRRTT